MIPNVREVNHGRNSGTGAPDIHPLLDFPGAILTRALSTANRLKRRRPVDPRPDGLYPATCVTALLVKCRVFPITLNRPQRPESDGAFICISRKQ
ncbi:MAG: hypothetical protein ABIH70_02690 [Chloroflexota bacterium]